MPLQKCWLVPIGMHCDFLLSCEEVKAWQPPIDTQVTLKMGYLVISCVNEPGLAQLIHHPHNWAIMRFFLFNLGNISVSSCPYNFTHVSLLVLLFILIWITSSLLLCKHQPLQVIPNPLHPLHAQTFQEQIVIWWIFIFTETSRCRQFNIPRVFFS